MKITIAQALPCEFQGVKGKDVAVKEVPILVPWPTRYNNDWHVGIVLLLCLKVSFGRSWALILGRHVTCTSFALRVRGMACALYLYIVSFGQLQRIL